MLSKREFWCPALVAVLCNAVYMLRRRQQAYEEDRIKYQAFIDWYPTTTYSKSYGERQFGQSQALKPPSFVDRFDWYVNEWDGIPSGNVSDPQTILFEGNYDLLGKLLSVAEHDFTRDGANRVLVFGGDIWLSSLLGFQETTRKETLSQLRIFFETISVMAVDASIDGVRTMPIGLAEEYLRGPLALRAEAAINSAGTNISAKPRGVLAAWGKHMDFERYVLAHEVLLEARAAGTYSDDELDRFANINATSVHQRLARQWVSTAAALEAGVEERSIDPPDWWSELARYRFMFSPFGTGIQRHAVVEALLVLTVPIVPRGTSPVFENLVRLGFPIVIVDDWQEITKANLELWWQDISPRLESFRSRCLTTEWYWSYATGRVDSCL